MKRTHAICIFGAPLLVPLLVVGIQRWHSETWSNFDAGGFKDEVSGERAGIKKLSSVIATGQERGRVRVSWMVFKKAPNPTPRRPVELWLYGLVYETHNGRMMRYYCSPRSTDANQVEAAQYDEVSNITLQAAARDGATCAGLSNYGAVPTRRGRAIWKDGRGPVFE